MSATWLHDCTCIGCVFPLWLPFVDVFIGKGQHIRIQQFIYLLYYYLYYFVPIGTCEYEQSSRGSSSSRRYYCVMLSSSRAFYLIWIVTDV